MQFQNKTIFCFENFSFNEIQNNRYKIVVEMYETYRTKIAKIKKIRVFGDENSSKINIYLLKLHNS